MYLGSKYYSFELVFKMLLVNPGTRSKRAQSSVTMVKPYIIMFIIILSPNHYTQIITACHSVVYLHHIQEMEFLDRGHSRHWFGSQMVGFR